MIYDIKEFLKNCIKSRVFVLFVAMAVVFAIMLGRVFSLQIINGENYQKNFTQLIEKTVPIEATRGNIYDCNGKLLAYNQLAYSVVVTDAYANTSNRNEDLNKELAKRGFQISNGYGDLKEKTFRIAHMADITVDEVKELLDNINDILGLQ